MQLKDSWNPGNTLSYTEYMDKYFANDLDGSKAAKLQDTIANGLHMELCIGKNMPDAKVNKYELPALEIAKVEFKKYFFGLCPKWKDRSPMSKRFRVGR